MYNPIVKKLKDLVYDIDALDLEDSLTNGEITELIEYVNVKQNSWDVDSPGWKILEAFKSLIREFKEDDGDGRHNL